MAGPDADLGRDHGDDEEHHERGDVILARDPQRQVGLGEHEVEGERRDHCRGGAGDAPAHDRGEQHRQDEREGHVGVGQVVTERHEGARDDEHPERAGPHSPRDPPVAGIGRTAPQEFLS